MLTVATVPFQWTYFPMQQIVSQDVWENEYIMEEVRRIADETPIEGGKCFCYSAFHIFTEVIRVGISLAICSYQIVVFKLTV